MIDTYTRTHTRIRKHVHLLSTAIMDWYSQRGKKIYILKSQPKTKKDAGGSMRCAMLGDMIAEAGMCVCIRERGKKKQKKRVCSCQCRLLPVCLSVVSVCTCLHVCACMQLCLSLSLALSQSLFPSLSPSLSLSRSSLSSASMSCLCL